MSPQHPHPDVPATSTPHAQCVLLLYRDRDKTGEPAILSQLEEGEFQVGKMAVVLVPAWRNQMPMGTFCVATAETVPIWSSCSSDFSGLARWLLWSLAAKLLTSGLQWATTIPHHGVIKNRRRHHHPKAKPEQLATPPLPLLLPRPILGHLVNLRKKSNGKSYNPWLCDLLGIGICFVQG